MYSLSSRSACFSAHTLSMSTPWYIKARRRAKDLGLSYQAMADRLGVKKATVGHWMTGRHYPSLTRLEEIAAMLETSQADLISEDENFVHTEEELNAVREIREMPAEYRAQAVAMLRAFRASFKNPDDDPR